MSQPTGHLDQLLPWYINGTLAHGDRQRVETHLRECEQCRAAAAFWQQLHARMQAPAEEPPPGESGLEQPRRWRLVRAPRTWWPPALAAAVAVIAVQAVLLAHLARRPSAAVPPARGPVPQGAVLQIRFAATATERQIRQTVQAVNGVFVGGPGAFGVYRIRLESAGVTPERDLDRAIAQLRAQRTVVDYVMPD